eukprot:498146-Pyramimonas_sp.AAC.1
MWESVSSIGTNTPVRSRAGSFSRAAARRAKSCDVFSCTMSFPSCTRIGPCPSSGYLREAKEVAWTAMRAH